MWITSALSLFAVARSVPSGRSRNYLSELLIAVAAALICGAVATALDFGGWREADWRALLFVLFGTAAAMGAQRALHLART